jgi:hypothetical protein
LNEADSDSDDSDDIVRGGTIAVDETAKNAMILIENVSEQQMHLQQQVAWHDRWFATSYERLECGSEIEQQP